MARRASKSRIIGVRNVGFKIGYCGTFKGIRFKTHKKKIQIESIIKSKLSDFGIRIHNLGIASNHIHILISFKSRRKYFSWIRSITGLIARTILGSKKGKPSGKSFWTYRPFTRVVFWGRDFSGVFNYILKNILEANGFMPYEPRRYKGRSTA